MYSPLFTLTKKPWLKSASTPPYVRAASQQWFFDLRTRAWLRDDAANADYAPLTVKLFDGDSPDDRVLLIGSEDGYIRYFDKSVAQDDSTTFISQVTIGPLKSDGQMRNTILSELQAILDLNSASISYEIMSGDTPEDALNTEAATFTGSDGTFAAGLSVADNPRTRGFYQYIKIGTNAASASWSFEFLKAKLMTITTDRGRARG